MTEVEAERARLATLLERGDRRGALRVITNFPTGAPA